MNHQNWTVAEPPPRDLLEAIRSVDARIDELAALLLANRGVTEPDAIRAFLEPQYTGLVDPFVIPDMDIAVARIVTALERGEKLGVIGDFDVDGLTATALLVLSLRGFGGEVVAYIPERVAEGHGLPTSAVDEFKRLGVSLLITADTGSVEFEGIAYAAENGIDCIVSDHHLLADSLPDAVAVLNPHRCDEADLPLSGAGVAFKLAQGVGRALRSGTGADTAVALAALGTIADVVPLVGENRIIASQGLRSLSRTEHPGLSALIALAGRNVAPGRIDSETVAFHLAPRLNAPGRLGSARKSLDLLLCDDPENAARLASEVEGLNRTRRKLSRDAWEMATQALSARGDPGAVITVVIDQLAPGVLGPLAGRLCGEFRRPAVVVSIDGDEARGSARSVPGFDVHAALAFHRAEFTRFGGHARAAGFSLPAHRVTRVLEAMTERAQDELGLSAQEGLTADAEIKLSDLTPSLWSFLDDLSPFGEGNPSPVFVTKGLLPMQVGTAGATGDHLKITLDHRGVRMQAIGFGLGRANLGAGLVDAAYGLRTDHWNGAPRRMLELKAIWPSDAMTS